MEKIASFRINHLTLMPGIYESRIDDFGNGQVATTFDIRMTAPNRQPALSIGALHAMEHIVATWLRNHPRWRDRIVYWGPWAAAPATTSLSRATRILMRSAL